jgi:hypothetical protein
MRGQQAYTTGLRRRGERTNEALLTGYVGEIAAGPFPDHLDVVFDLLALDPGVFA